MTTSSVPRPVPLGITKRDLARLVTGIENGVPEALRSVYASYPRGGRARIVGITGPPGSGKSTLVAALAKLIRSRGHTVAIISVDPSSPFTGGAILGDRIRMRELFEDPGVFIRSMANRGASGGVARTTADVAAALDAAGYDWVFIETVGVGQAEVEVARMAETVVVVEASGLGDDVQAIKAGVLEIADILVVNKADREGAERAVSALQAALDLATPAGATTGHHSPAADPNATRVPQPPASQPDGWRPPVLKTIATDGTGVEGLLEAIEAHGRYLADGAGRQRRVRCIEQEVLARLRDQVVSRTMQHLEPARYRALIEACAARDLHPEQAAQALFDALMQAMADRAESRRSE